MRASLKARARGVLAMVGLAAPMGCAGLTVPDRDVEALERGAIATCDVVLLCHGMFYDFGIPWDYRMRETVRERGGVGLIFTHWMDPLSVVFNYGCLAPGDLMALVADSIWRLHEKSGCEVPLRIHGVAFSAGSEAMIRAAERADEARFERFVLIHSSSIAPAWEIDALVREDKLGGALNFWSPLDLLTLGAPLGSGALSLWSSEESVENRIDAMPHLPAFITEAKRQEICDYLGLKLPRDAAQPERELPPEQREFARQLAAFLRETRTASN